MRRSTVTLIVLVLVTVVSVVAVVLTASRPSSSSGSNTPSDNSPDSSQSQSNDNPPSSDSDVQQAPVAGTIYIKDTMFTPSQISIPKGSAVTWTNNDEIDHTVTVDRGNGPVSGSIGPGASYTYTFDVVGSFQYHCDIHKSMRATIVVQ